MSQEEEESINIQSVESQSVMTNLPQDEEKNEESSSSSTAAATAAGGKAAAAEGGGGNNTKSAAVAVPGEAGKKEEEGGATKDEGRGILSKRKTKPLNVQVKKLSKKDVLVEEFLEELRTVRLCCCTIKPEHIFGLTVILFMLPCLWGCVSVLLDADLPPTVFFDRCRNGSGDPIKFAQGEATVEYNYSTCVSCNNHVPYVFTNASSVTTSSRYGFAGVVVGANALLTLIAIAFFIRLSVKEFAALYLLSFDILVETKLNPREVCMVVVVALLCLVASAINVAYAVALTLSADNIPLGWKDNATAPVGNCFDNNSLRLFAIFNVDNPSLANTVRPENPISIVKAILASFILYVPIVIRLTNLVRALYNSFDVQDLMHRSRITSKIFKELAWSVKYEDLYEAIEEFADSEEAEQCGMFSCCTRFWSLHWDCIFCCGCSEPPADLFALTWGTEDTTPVPEDGDTSSGAEYAINCILSILLHNKKLRPYTGDDEEMDIEFRQKVEKRKEDHHQLIEKKKTIRLPKKKNDSSSVAASASGAASTNPLKGNGEEEKKEEEEKQE